MLRNVPRYVWVATLIGVVVSLPTLAIGFIADDYNHLLMLHGLDIGTARPFDMYRFFEGNLQPLVFDGILPWWTDPELHVAFLRPIASAMFVLDHTLFGMNAVGYHVHGLLWYVALLICVGLYYRRVFGEEHGRVAALGAIIFAVDEAHAFPVGWIAARYGLVATLFMVLALWAHQRFREDGWRRGQFWAPVALCASLAAGESGLTTIVFVFGYELLGAKGSWRERARAFAPYLGIGVAYVVLHGALGYGVNGSGIYVHPFSSTARYLAVIPERMSLVFGTLFATLPVDAALLDPRFMLPFVGVGLVMALLFVWLFLAVVRREQHEPTRRTLRWLVVASMLSFVPSLGAPVGGRLALSASVGLSPVFAFIVIHAWRWAKESRGLRRIAWGAGAVWLAWQQVVVPIPVTVLGHLGMREQGVRGRRVLREMPVPVTSEAHIVFLCASDVFVAVYGIGPRLLEQGHRPASWQFASLNPKPHRVERTAEQTLVLSVVDGHLLETSFEHVFRDGYPELGFEVGNVAFTAKVVEADNGRPTRLSLTFKHALEGDAMHLLHLTRDGVQHVPVPAIGESVVLPAGPTPLDVDL